MSEEHESMRGQVALEYGFKLYRDYAEKEAAAFIRRDLSTLKRWRRAGKVRFVKAGDDGVRYMGFHIADMILLGTAPWPDDTAPANLNLALTGSDSEPGAKPGIDAGKKDALPNASASAQRILKKQNSG